MHELLLRMFASTLRRDIHHGPLKQLQQCLLHTLTCHVARYGRVVALTGNLVYFVDEDDSEFRLFGIIVRFLEQAGKDAFNILSHISCFSKNGCVHYRERHLDHLCDGLRKERLPRSGRADEKDIGLLQFNSVVTFFQHIVQQAFIMVVHGNGKQFLSSVLANHIFVQESFDLLGFGKILY